MSAAPWLLLIGTAASTPAPTAAPTSAPVGAPVTLTAINASADTTYSPEFAATNVIDGNVDTFSHNDFPWQNPWVSVQVEAGESQPPSPCPLEAPAAESIPPY